MAVHEQVKTEGAPADIIEQVKKNPVFFEIREMPRLLDERKTVVGGTDTQQLLGHSGDHRTDEKRKMGQMIEREQLSHWRTITK